MRIGIIFNPFRYICMLKAKCDLMSVNKTLHILLLLLCSASLWAVPARRVAITVEQPDGTQLTLSLCGDEHFHFIATSDGVPVVRHEGAYYYACWRDGAMESSGQLAHDASLRTSDESALVATLEDVRATCTERMQQVRARRSASARKSSEVPTSGDVRVPVLLVQYADVVFSMSDPQTVFEQRIGGEGDVSKGTGSVRDYFVAQSEGQFRPQFDVIGPITLDKDMEYYGGNDKDGNDLRAREMVSEACRKAFSAAGVDFSLYDNDKDGYVDIVYVIYAGFGEASYPDMLENTIWPHQWQLEAPLSLGGVKVNRYACNNELKGYRGTELAGIGTFCHEFSHCLGLPDFYDTSSEGNAFGLDAWSVMDYGCYNNDGHTPCGYTAYEKNFLGWTPLVELCAPTQVTLKPLCEGGEAYKIVNDANPDEFYVVEYLDRVGWNTYAPASGMLVLHIDYLESAWQDNIVNNDPLHQRVSVIPADGQLSSQTLAGDVYPGTSRNTCLTADSYPAAEVYIGGYMSKDITNIVSDGGVVTFSFMEGALLPPSLHAPSDIHTTGFTLTWEASPEAEAYDVLLNILGDDGDEMSVHTDRVSECSYTFEGLSEGVYRCYVRSVRQGASSSYSIPVQVELADTLLPSAGAAPYIIVCNDSICIQGPEGAEVYYTTDGSYPTAYSMRYTVPFATTEKITVRAMARREGYRNTPVAQFANWFEQGGATYRVTSTEPSRVVVSESPEGNGEGGYAGHYIFGDVVRHDTATYILDGFDAGVFRDAVELRSVTVKSSSMHHVGDSLFHGCTSLNAVVWESPCAMPDEAFDEDSYRNLLVYLPDTATVPTSLTRAAYTTLIHGGHCEELVLDATSAFYCPRSFIAGRVTYRRTFKQTTGIGSSSGWETLVLPFDVEHITHSTKGDITPFGVEGTSHCWLATPQDGAFADATEIQANQPYIIAFPHNDAYGGLSLAGSITFSADDATIYPVHPETKSVACGWAAVESEEQWDTVSLALVPTYDPVEASDGVYALNVGAKYGDYMPGSVFVSGRYDTPPFSVYIVPMEDVQPAPFYHIAAPSSEDHEGEYPDSLQELSIASRDGYLRIVSPKECTVRLYDAVGRLVLNVVCNEGITEVGPLEEGMYIIERTKIHVWR